MFASFGAEDTSAALSNLRVLTILCSGLDKEFGYRGSQGSQSIDRSEAFSLLDLFTYLALVHRRLAYLLNHCLVIYLNYLVTKASTPGVTSPGSLSPKKLTTRADKSTSTSIQEGSIHIQTQKPFNHSISDRHRTWIHQRRWYIACCEASQSNECVNSDPLGFPGNSSNWCGYSNNAC